MYHYNVQLVSVFKIVYLVLHQLVTLVVQEVLARLANALNVIQLIILTLMDLASPVQQIYAFAIVIWWGV